MNSLLKLGTFTALIQSIVSVFFHTNIKNTEDRVATEKTEAKLQGLCKIKMP